MQQLAALEPRPMKFPPLDPGKPVTNKQLAEQNARLHDCLHNVGERVDRLVDTVRENREAAMERDQLMALDVAQIKGALGVDPSCDKQHRTLAGIKPWKAALAVAGAMGGVQIGYQIFAPVIVAAAKALNASLMGG